MLLCSAGGAAAACDMVGSGSVCVLEQRRGAFVSHVSLSAFICIRSSALSISFHLIETYRIMFNAGALAFDCWNDLA
jgi:hypothetical protein